MSATTKAPRSRAKAQKTAKGNAMPTAKKQNHCSTGASVETLSATSLESVFPIAKTPANVADHALIDAAASLIRNELLYQSIMDDGAENDVPDVDALPERVSTLLDKLCRMHAHTLDGLLARQLAFNVWWKPESDDNPSAGWEERIPCAMARDVREIASSPSQPPRVGDEVLIQQCDLAVALDAACNAPGLSDGEAAPLAANYHVVIAKIGKMRPTTPEGVAALVRALRTTDLASEGEIPAYEPELVQVLVDAVAGGYRVSGISPEEKAEAQISTSHDTATSAFASGQRSMTNTFREQMKTSCDRVTGAWFTLDGLLKDAMARGMADAQSSFATTSQWVIGRALADLDWMDECIEVVRAEEREEGAA